MRSTNSMLRLATNSRNQPRQAGVSFRPGRRRGFTLVETMIATLVFAMGILGVYAMMIKSYELVALARHRDNSRAVLMSFADQFLRLQTTDMVPGSGIVTRGLFATTATPTGVGLNWTDTTGTRVVGTAAGLTVALGDSGSSEVPATVTRSVTNLNVPSGDAVSGVTATAAGWMLQATFTIDYTIKGRPQTQSLTVARSVR
jgi:prepilin-type N-terminal cleavage/methylation domain-containing protein